MSDQRKNRRFPLRLPLQLIRPEQVSVAAETRNVSSGGVSFSSTTPLTPDDPVEYEITLLDKAESGGPVRIRCMGKIVRADDVSCAATLERYEFVR